MPSIGDLFISLGFNVDNAKLNEFNDKITNAQKNLVKVGAGATAAVYGLNRFLNSSVKSAESMRNYREQTGYATEELYKFYNAASRANTNVDLSQIIDTYRALADTIAQAQRGNLPAGSLWAGMGDINGSTPDEIIDRIYEKIPELLQRYKGDRALILQDLAEMGIGPDVAQSFFLPRDQWNAFRNLPTPTDKQLKAIESLAQSYKRFSNEYAIFKFRMAENIAPNFEKFIDFVSTKALPVIEDFTSKVAIQLQPALEGFAFNMGAVFTAVRDAISGTGFQIDESTGLIAGLVLLYAKLNPVRWAVVALVAALNELGKKINGEENWIDKSLDSAAALAVQIPGGKDLDFVKNRLNRMGLTPEDFGGNIIQKGVEALNRSAEQTELHKMHMINRNGGYPPQPYPIAPSEQNITVAPQYNINTTANPRDMWDSLASHEQMMFRNASLDMLYNQSGVKTGGY